MSLELGRNFVRGKRHTPKRWAPASTKDGPVAYDLFAGAGLFSSAFRDEGVNISRAIELDPVAAETYAASRSAKPESGPTPTSTAGRAMTAWAMTKARFSARDNVSSLCVA